MGKTSSEPTTEEFAWRLGGQSLIQYPSWLQIKHGSLDQHFDGDPLEVWNVVGPGVILGLWPWSYCRCKANSFDSFFLNLWSCSKVLSKCSTPTMSSVRPVGLPSFFFFLFINPLISEEHPFTNRADTANLNLFVWNLEPQQEHLPMGFKKTLTDSSFFCLHVWLIHQSVQAGKIVRMAFKS